MRDFVNPQYHQTAHRFQSSFTKELIGDGPRTCTHDQGDPQKPWVSILKWFDFRWFGVPPPILGKKPQFWTTSLFDVWAWVYISWGSQIDWSVLEILATTWYTHGQDTTGSIHSPVCISILSCFCWFYLHLWFQCHILSGYPPENLTNPTENHQFDRDFPGISIARMPGLDHQRLYPASSFNAGTIQVWLKSGNGHSS